MRDATGHDSFTSRDRRLCALLVVILGVMYLLLHGGRWVPGTDMQYYLDIARSLAAGRGYAFNDSPAGLVPPGWPYVLAGLMRISDAFWFLNLVPAAMMLYAAGTYYWVVRRVAGPERSLGLVLLSFLFFWSYVSSMLLTSEALFMALFAPALLLAMQIGDGRRERWRIVVLALLGAALVFVRFTGLIVGLVIVGAMMGRKDPHPNPLSGRKGVEGPQSDHARGRGVGRPWLAVAVIACVTVGTFWFVDGYLMDTVLPATVADPPAVSAADRRLGGTPDDTPSVLPAMSLSAIGNRIAQAGRWISSLFWMPAEIGVSSRVIGLGVNVVGWVLIALFGVRLVQRTRAGEWLWLGVLLYCGALCVRWKVPNARYLLPVAPLLLVGVHGGLEQLARMASGAAATALVFLRRLLIGSLIACSLAMWGVDVWVSKSSDYYGRYYAGHARELIAIAVQLGERGIGDADVAVSAEYLNLGRTRTNGFGLRTLRLLTGRRVLVVPPDVCSTAPNADLGDWASEQGVRYYVHRPPTSPWRVWHFRMGWLQRMAGKDRNPPENPFFELYERESNAVWYAPARWRKVELPAVEGNITRMPG